MEQESIESGSTVTVYKIQSLTNVTCYIGSSPDPERIRELHFTDSPNDTLRKAVSEEGIEKFTFKIIVPAIPAAEAVRRVVSEIEKHKKWAVFNRQNPLQARESDLRRIEVFCQHFDIPYDEVLEHPQNFRIPLEEFNRMKEDIILAKKQVETGLFQPNEIEDPILRAFAKRYETVKAKAKALDFPDMLTLSACLLEGDPDLRQFYHNEYPYVLVDEFQDISPVDFRKIRLLSENLFVVGDDDQAIYGFRGGDSGIMQKFGTRKDVTAYEITRNYRSTATIVRHSKALIEHNPRRISKNLHAEKRTQSRLDVLATLPDTVGKVLLDELLPNELTAVGILARNRSEVRKIEEIIRPALCGTRKIEVSTIHAAKGREWEKVILVVNTMLHGKVRLPDSRNNLEDERCLFYVGVTRAKEELVILGRNCKFISEFQNVPSRDTLEIELAALKSELRKAAEAEHKRYASELDCLQAAANEAVNAKAEKERQLEIGLLQQLKFANEAFLEQLISVLDKFDTVLESATEKVGSSNASTDFATVNQSVRLVHQQLLDFLSIHGLKPIEAVGERFDPAQHEALHELYSDEVSTGAIIEEYRRGYLLNNRVVRKAQVAVPYGQSAWTDEELERVVEIYFDRAIRRCGHRLGLTCIYKHKPTIVRQVTQYLKKLGNQSIEEIVSFASIDVAEVIDAGRFADYCVGPENTHICTNVFQGFWNRMWEVVEQSRFRKH